MICRDEPAVQEAAVGSNFDAGRFRVLACAVFFATTAKAESVESGTTATARPALESLFGRAIGRKAGFHFS
jgi:hypothetical protein